MVALSDNAKAILLLTAPLGFKENQPTADLLSPSDYKGMARRLREMQREPADLLSSEGTTYLQECQDVIDAPRLQSLLGRGFLLAQAVERWQSRAIWVVSRADAAYPARLKARLREDAPAVLYGCGDAGLLDEGGLAVVGSRDADAELLDYARDIGRQAAAFGNTIISGGARGIDLAAMGGALMDQGRAVGVLADSLERAVMDRDNRCALMDGRLLLMSPYDPGAGFNVGHAMQRNKLIYACADAALVVSADLGRGGTWAGAVEQLEKLRMVPVYVRPDGKTSPGLDALRSKGAVDWMDAEAAIRQKGRVQVPSSPARRPVQQKLGLF